MVMFVMVDKTTEEQIAQTFRNLSDELYFSELKMVYAMEEQAKPSRVYGNEVFFN